MRRSGTRDGLVWASALALMLTFAPAGVQSQSPTGRLPETPASKEGREAAKKLPQNSPVPAEPAGPKGKARKTGPRNESPGGPGHSPTRALGPRSQKAKPMGPSGASKQAAPGLAGVKAKPILDPKPCTPQVTNTPTATPGPGLASSSPSNNANLSASQGAAAQAVVAANPRKKTKTQAKKTLGAIGATIKLRGSLKLESEQPVPDQVLRFFVAGTPVGVAKTDKKGDAVLSFHVPPSMGVGSKPYTVAYAGSSRCEKSQDDVTVGLIKASTILSAKPVSPKTWATQRAGRTLQVEGRLLRTTDQQKVSGRAIVATLNGVQVASLATDGSGRYRFDHKIPKSFGSSAQLAVTFAGDALYAPYEVSKSFSVLPASKKAYLVVPELTGKLGETIEFKALLHKTKNFSPGSGFNGGEIRFWAKGGPTYDPKNFKLGEKKSNSLGAIKFPVHLDLNSGHLSGGDLPRTFRVHAYADDGGIDLEYSNSGKLRILPAPVKITVTGPSSAKIGDEVQLVAIIRRTTDNARVGGVMLTGPGPDGETDGGGRRGFFFNVGSSGGTGNRTYKIKFAGGKGLKAGEGAHTMNILPSTN